MRPLLYRWNENSITRAQPFFNVRTYGEMLGTYSRLADNLLARRRPDLYADLIATIISNAYIDSRPGNWDAAPPECAIAAKAAIAERVRGYRAHYEAADEAFRRRKYHEALANKRACEPPAGFAGIGKWMDALEADAHELVNYY